MFFVCRELEKQLDIIWYKLGEVVRREGMSQIDLDRKRVEVLGKAVLALETKRATKQKT